MSSFCFPKVLRRMDYASRLSARDYLSLTLSAEEAQNLVRRYYREMTKGVAYDRECAQAWNRSSADVLTAENVKNANRIHARLGLKKCAPILNVPLPGLPRVPQQAELFDSTAHDASAAAALACLDNCPGIEAANATKLLHQKRPRCFPILDQFVRRALGMPYVKRAGEAGYRALLDQYRSFLRVQDNAHVFQGLYAWTLAHVHTPWGAPSRVRVLDILAWGLIVYRDPFKRRG
ncbi:MAG: hypothetical protein HS116_18730 [Planctomycetes bacterium]|nr:hypothetical protein [Planctomycetota bacterium]